MEVPTDIRTPNDLQAYLTEHHIPAEIIHMQSETPTVPAAAAALDVEVDAVAKTIIFFINEQPYAVIACGVRRVDFKKLAAKFDVNRKKVKLADSDAVIRLTGYAPGTVPPVGHREVLPVLMESSITEREIVYAGGGGIAAMLKVRGEDLLRITKAELVNVLEDQARDVPAE
jgi:Cys-tRNA(Pro) deacylase